MDHKALIKGTVFLLCLLMVVPASMSANFESKVISVLDGDTTEVLHEKKTERIRLYGIDCPEKSQAFGQKAKHATSALIFGKDLRIETLVQQGPGVAAMGVDASASIQATNSLEKMLAHQLAAVHRAVMDHMALVPSQYDVATHVKRNRRRY